MLKVIHNLDRNRVTSFNIIFSNFKRTLDEWVSHSFGGAIYPYIFIHSFFSLRVILFLLYIELRALSILGWKRQPHSKGRKMAEIDVPNGGSGKEYGQFVLTLPFSSTKYESYDRNGD